jgi:hypothetical protein
MSSVRSLIWVTCAQPVTSVRIGVVSVALQGARVIGHRLGDGPDWVLCSKPLGHEPRRVGPEDVDGAPLEVMVLAAFLPGNAP